MQGWFGDNSWIIRGWPGLGQVWLGDDPAIFQGWFRHNSGNYPEMVKGWFRGSSGMILGCSRDGSKITHGLSSDGPGLIQGNAGITRG